MNVGDLPTLMGPYLMVQMGAAAVGLLASIGVAVRLIQNRPLAPGIALLPVVVPGLVVLICALLGASGGVGSDPTQAMAVNIGSRVVGWLWLWPSTAVLLLACAVGSVRAPKRRPAVAGLAALLGLVIVALPWGYGLAMEDNIGAGTRSAFYLPVCILVAVAMLGDDDDGSKLGSEYGVIASVAGLWFVAGGEMFLYGLSYMGLVIGFGALDPGKFDAYMLASQTEVFELMSPWDLLTVGASALLALVALGSAAQVQERRMRVLSALPWILLAPCLVLLGNPSVEALRALYDATQ